VDDEQFLSAFEAAAIPNHAFRHREHLRMAWLYVRRDGAAAGTERICAGLQRFAAAHGVPHLHHDTLTRFWARLMAHVVEVFPGLARFEDVLACYDGFEDRRLAYRHWRADTLDAPLARRQWVEPDLVPLP
jgi:N-formylglutamate deformylase